MSEPGTCPECDGTATVYRNPDTPTRGHIYCNEDACGWIHRDKPGVDRYTTGCSA